MKKLLRIDASPRFEGSHSRALADEFVDAWLARNTDATVTLRDLALAPPPHVDAARTAAFTNNPDQRSPPLNAVVVFSDILINEFLEADEVVIASPMHNFGVPSSLKAYIDHIVRAARTFSYDPATGFAGLAKTRRAYLALAYGVAGYVDGPMSSMDFLKPYLEGVLRFIGVPQVETIYVEGVAFDPAAAQQSKAAVPKLIEDALSA